MKRAQPAPDLSRDQQRAQVAAIYEALMQRDLGVSFARSLALPAALRRHYLSRAFAIATASGRKAGLVRKRGNQPTVKGRKRAAKFSQTHEVRLAKYEKLLSSVRKG